MVLLVERFKYPQLLRFKDLFEPPLTVDRFNSARKELKRHGMLSKIELNIRSLNLKSLFLS